VTTGEQAVGDLINVAAGRSRIRVVNVYALARRYHPAPSAGRTLAELGLSKVAWQCHPEQQPTGLHLDALDVSEVGLAQVVPSVQLLAASVGIFTLPSDQVIATLVVDFDSSHANIGPATVAAVLESCTGTSIQLRGRPLPEVLAEIAARADILASGAEAIIAAERHQLVMLRSSGNGDIDDLPGLKQLFFDGTHNHSGSTVPPFEIGRSGDPQVVVGTSRSLLVGLDQLAEDSATLAAIKIVGTASRLARLRQETHHTVRAFLENRRDGAGYRNDFETLIDEVGALQLDLGINVELALLPITPFYNALVDAAQLLTQAQNLGQILDRIEGSIGSVFVANDIHERQVQDLERNRARVRSALVSAIALPFTFLAAFFGINASQVSSTYSIFDLRHYAAAYLVAACLAIFPLLGIAGPLSSLYARRRRRG
jgi:hypothetical protein